MSSTTDLASPTISRLVIALLVVVTSLSAQEQHKKKVPVLDKIATGTGLQAFSGNVQSLDTKRDLLNVMTVEGGATETFPVSRKVKVSAANGSKLTAADLTPGTNVIVYYEQKGDHRTVRQIVVLERAAAPGKKPSSS